MEKGLNIRDYIVEIEPLTLFIACLKPKMACNAALIWPIACCHYIANPQEDYNQQQVPCLSLKDCSKAELLCNNH